MVPPTSPPNNRSGGQQEEGYGVVHQFNENIINLTIIKMPASRRDKFSVGWTKCRYPMWISPTLLLSQSIRKEDLRHI